MLNIAMEMACVCVSSFVHCLAPQLSQCATALCIDLLVHSFHQCWRPALSSLVGVCIVLGSLY